MGSIDLEEVVSSQRNETEHLKKKVDIMLSILDDVLLWNEKLVDALFEKIKVANDKKVDIAGLTDHLKNTLGRMRNGR